MNNELTKLIRLAQGNRTQNQYALNCGVSSAAITRICSGEYDPKPPVLEKLALHASNGVTYQDLMSAAGYLLGITENKSVKLPSNVFPLSKPIKLPILGEIRAGEPLYTDQGYSDEWDYEDEIYNDGNHYFLRVKGNSMSPTIPEGALAVIRAQTYAERGDIVACCFNDDCATLKRYYPQPDGSVLLRAENADSESYVIPPEQFENGSANIIGIVREVKIKLHR